MGRFSALQTPCFPRENLLLLGHTKTKTMIDLKEFDFYPHEAGFRAIGLFPNNFGVSVIPEADQQHYEVAVLEHNGKGHSQLCYTSGLTEDVFRWCDVDGVHDIIAMTRNLESGTFVYDEPEPIDEVY
jgi:hypothetical protein